MKDFIKEINKYYESKGVIDKFKSIDTAYTLSLYIAKFAHKDKYRLNGYNYIIHPLAMKDRYEDYLINKEKLINDKLAFYVGLPFYGVLEVCMLHDVIEDTNITFEDIESLFKEYKFDYYFDECIAKPLKLITHDKSESYEIYINKLLDDPKASLVKLLDMQDNLDLFSLDTLNEESEKRAIKYLHYCKVINDKWQFIQRINIYEKLKDKLDDVKNYK